MEELNSPGGIPVDPEYGRFELLEDEGSDSAYSQASSIHDFRVEHDRRYREYMEGHPFPYDEVYGESEASLHELVYLLLDHKYFLSPINESSLRCIADLGTGSGLWAEAVAHRYPDTNVVGMDFSYRNSVEPNCSFLLQDITEEFILDDTSTTFDLIHIRNLYFDVKGWESIYTECFKNMKAGGWIEQYDVVRDAGTDDDSELPNSEIRKLSDLQRKIAVASGRDFQVSSKRKQTIEAAGFVDVQEQRVKLPLGPWPTDPKLKDIGRFFERFYKTSLQDWLMQSCTTLLGWTRKEVNSACARAFQEINSRQQHFYFQLVIIIGRKPTEAEWHTKPLESQGDQNLHPINDLVGGVTRALGTVPSVLAPLRSHKSGSRWDEDLDSLSDLSEVSSVQSLPSLVSDSSSASILDKYASKAVEHVSALFLEDHVLASMYETAVAKLGRERFLENHDRLLKAFFNDIRSEAQHPVQLVTIRDLRRRHRRHEITLLIHNIFEPLNIHKQETMRTLRDQKPSRKQLLDDYLRSTSTAPMYSQMGLESNNVAPLDQNVESADKGDDSSTSDDDDDPPLGQKDRETYSYLEPLETFITKGNAFARFRSNFNYLLRPPTNLEEALKSRDFYIIQRFLARNFPAAASSDYEWLHELDEAGYSKSEIAELLLGDICESPWIHFTPKAQTKHRIRTMFHVTGCAHQENFDPKPQSLPHSESVHSRSLPLYGDIGRQVEECCGIGGVVPSSRDVSSWNGSVTFEERSSVSMVTYAVSSRTELLVRISNVLDKFCTAAAAVQSAELCCDSFTVLLRMGNCLELRRIELRPAAEMAFYINLVLQDDNTQAALRRCVQRAEYILQELRVTIPETIPDVDLHYCALAAQFLCTAFLSYIQAHVGSIDPFFLDTPQRKIILLGNQRIPGDFAVNAELVELTCLAAMTQQPVLAFSSGVSNQEMHSKSEPSRYDILTNAEDCLDTWGPGYFVHNKANPNKIHAIAIGGGYVSLVDTNTSLFHWAKGTPEESASWATFEAYTIMRIGTAVRINQNCNMDESAYRKSSFCALEPLGTRGVFWEAQERQAGFQAGQYLTGTYSQTWNKIPGITLKQRNLQRSDWHLIHFLEQSWGLQVSFCTSVARRVSLRELVTDLLPTFVNPLEQDTWEELVNSHNIIQNFTRGNLFDWLRTLSPLLQIYVLALIRAILEQLQHTGLDRRNATLAIAWPQEGDIERGLKIPCKAQTYWAQIIADAEDCATFAYVTPKCLETNHVKCRGLQRAWQNASKVLVTEMSPSQPEGQPINANNNATSTDAASVTTTIIAAQTDWELEDKKTYYIKKLDSLLRVKVEKPSSASNDVAHLVVTSSNIPRGLWKRLLVKEEDQPSAICAMLLDVQSTILSSSWISNGSAIMKPATDDVHPFTASDEGLKILDVDKQDPISERNQDGDDQDAEDEADVLEEEKEEPAVEDRYALRKCSCAKICRTDNHVPVQLRRSVCDVYEVQKTGIYQAFNEHETRTVV
ncbi:hypothetical protein PV04_08739 [Phialophora macrospora]|uniref:Methyltransferase domain-containing protein n=1 Tax=Phialophora macrospora TaxID=1851006 RepID=A0A0D2CF61_9EURO|nr:hypothetical protein PV04_08739 [Phialophora macrospora]